MYDIRSNFVEECSVVRDYQESARITLEIVRQEGDGGDVQHVGRFCSMSTQGFQRC